MGLFERLMGSSSGGLMDFNAQAQALAGPMPELPQFDFSPITLGSGGGGGNGGGNAPPGGNAGGASYIGQPTMGNQPYNAPPGQIGSGTPGSVGGVNDMMGQLNTMYGLGNPDAPNLMDMLGNVEWGDVGGNLLSGAAYLTNPMLGMVMNQNNQQQEPAAPQAAPPGTGGYMNVNLPGITLTDTGSTNPEGVNGLLGSTTSDSETITEEELAMILADGAGVTSGNSVDNEPTLLHQSGIDYGGNAGLSPAAAAIINRRYSVPPRPQN